MGRKKKQKNKMKKTGFPSNVGAFSFGDPEPVLDSRILSDHMGVYLLDNGRYYNLPFSMHGVARLRYANAYQGSLLELKINMVMRGFKPSKVLNRKTMKKLLTDYITFNNCYLQLERNFYGEVIKVHHLQAINMRRAKEPDTYCMLTPSGDIIDFQPGEVVHLKVYDVVQSIYGVPSYLGALQSMLLNEDATLFRRRYYKNGAHMGYIFYTAGNVAEDDQNAIEAAIKGSKGLGNFSNMYLHLPDGKDGKVEILPVGDFSTKDELEKIKKISRDDILAAHRIPPALASVIPERGGVLGDIVTADKVYTKNEVEPVRDDILEINEYLLSKDHVEFITEPDKTE